MVKSGFHFVCHFDSIYVFVLYIMHSMHLLTLTYTLARFLALVTTMVTKVDHGNHRSNHRGYYDGYYNGNT